MNKTARKEKNQRIAAEMKRLGIERTTGCCPICYKVTHADYLRGGMATHRCEGRKGGI